MFWLWDIIEHFVSDEFTNLLLRKLLNPDDRFLKCSALTNKTSLCLIKYHTVSTTQILGKEPLAPRLHGFHSLFERLGEGKPPLVGT
jgi:hypothetical protein